MANRPIAWEARNYSMDRLLRRWANAGVPVREQARELSISQESIYKRRSALGIRRKSKQERKAHV